MPGARESAASPKLLAMTEKGETPRSDKGRGSLWPLRGHGWLEDGVPVYLLTENPLGFFFALFSALFSINVFCGFFLSCFLISLPLLMFVAP